MTVKDVRDVLGARVLAGEEFLDREVKSAMRFRYDERCTGISKDHSVLLTGLCNPQVIRTAEMLDIVCMYPIYFDTEASGAGNGRADGLGVEDRTKCAVASAKRSRHWATNPACTPPPPGSASGWI